MKQPELKEIINYNPNTGVFTWRVKFSSRVSIGDVSGSEYAFSGGKTYRIISVNGKQYRAHRLAWLYMYGCFPEHQIDHINGDGTDNRIVNLRSVTDIENKRNKRKQSNNTSGVCGAVWEKSKRKWKSSISILCKKVHLGYFNNYNDAVIARKMSEQEHGFHQNHGMSRGL